MGLIKKIHQKVLLLKFYNSEGKKFYDKTKYFDKIQSKSKFKLKGNNHLWESEIGEHSYISHNTIVYCSTIGKYCSIGPNVIIGYGNHPTNFLSTSPLIFFRDVFPDFPKEPTINYFNSHEKISIGNDVWIGAQCYIKNGVTIGNGAVVGAGSIVLNDLPPYSIAVGTPAKVVRKRFSEEVIGMLEELKWWDLDVSQLKKIESFLSTEINPEVISKIKKTLDAKPI